MSAANPEFSAAPAPPFSLTTERLHLRPCPLFAAQVARFGRRHVESLLKMPVDPAWFTTDARGLFSYYADWLHSDPAQFGWGLWLIELRDQPLIIGSAGFKGYPNASGMIEIGYGIGPDYRRLGYTTEAVRALLAWGWEQAGVRTITAECLHHNHGSRRVLEKVGMTQTRAQGDFLYWRIERTPQEATTHE